ncbi:DUF7344 domain-containing protein [Halobacterium litoreum]|uniref:DUF7344 domain-containing protein n=1 Tax=Halobacterium litoreum TaxID=2039234 RepID=A0ABD5NAR1_9EURY|nr:hypothetical protein [Halobacterium litoreum]UHH14679.1 hypothetical protein LT972_06680 [Halobacterium litoreum]
MLEGTHTGGESGSQSDTGPSEPVAREPDSLPQPSTDGDEEADDQREELPLDVTFEILKNRRRRLVLEYLRETEDTITIGELAEHIAAIENDTTVQQLNAQQRKRVYIGLYQCHLPKMDDAGVVDFNQDRGRIDPGPNVEPLYEYLNVDAEEEEDVAFPTAHVGGYVAFAVLFFAAQMASAHAVATATVGVFLVAALAVSYRSYVESRAEQER